MYARDKAITKDSLKRQYCKLCDLVMVMCRWNIKLALYLEYIRSILNLNMWQCQKLDLKSQDLY